MGSITRKVSSALGLFLLDLKNLESAGNPNIQRSIFLNVFNCRIGKNGSQVQEMIP